LGKGAVKQDEAEGEPFLKASPRVSKYICTSICRSVRSNHKKEMKLRKRSLRRTLPLNQSCKEKVPEKSSALGDTIKILHR
jgi:hypothetical protein